AARDVSGEGLSRRVALGCRAKLVGLPQVRVDGARASGVATVSATLYSSDGRCSDWPTPSTPSHARRAQASAVARPNQTSASGGGPALTWVRQAVTKAGGRPKADPIAQVAALAATRAWFGS